MKTITSREDFADLNNKARKTVEAYLPKAGFADAVLKSIDIDEDMSCQMSVSYFFIFSYRDQDGCWESTGYITYFANGTQIIQTEPGEEEPRPDLETWNVIHDDNGNGALIYTLRQSGWHKGEPVMVNDVTVRVEGQNRSTTDISPVVDRIVAALSA